MRKQELKIALLALLMLPSTLVHGAGERPLKTGVWFGSIGTHAIMLCVENDKSSYYYPGQANVIDLNIASSETWTESVQGNVTGYWKILPRGDGNTDNANGEWRKRPEAAPQYFFVQFLADVPSACTSATYQQKLLNGPSLSLRNPEPSRGMVVAAPTETSAAVLKSNGDVWTWSAANPKPQFVGKDFVRIAMGSAHTLGIKKDGSLWGWGRNPNGQLGGDFRVGKEPVHMADGYVAIAANPTSSLAIRNDGTVWLWGGTSIDARGNLAEPLSDKPKFLGKSFVDVAATDQAYNAASFGAIKNDGTLWTWGSNEDGQLGIGRRGTRFNSLYRSEPFPVLVGPGFSAVSFGYYLGSAIKDDGSLWMWGCDDRWRYGEADAKRQYGELDDGTTIPVKFGDGFSQVAPGFRHVAAVRNDGALLLWRCTAKPAPVHMRGLELARDPIRLGNDFISVALGRDFWVGMKKDGSVWTQHWQSDDEVGTPAQENPTPVEF